MSMPADSIDLCDKILRYTAPFYKADDYGALQSQYDEWARARPLQGLSILDVTPLFRNTLLKYRNLLAAGAELTIGLSPFISHNADVLHFAEHDLGLRSTHDQGAYDVVLDCAGAYRDSSARLGYVELTRSGLEYYANKSCRVFMADSSRIKQIETEYGTGESFFRAMQAIGHGDFEGQRLVIFGSGKVGRGILREALRRGCHVTVVTDPATIDVPNSVEVIDYRDRERAQAAVDGAWAVVMATGVRGALSRTLDAARVSASNALLINMGAEDEMGEGFAPERLVEGGRTLNFILDEPTHLRYIDPTMALHNYGALYLKENTASQGVITPPQNVEDKILKTIKLDL